MFNDGPTGPALKDQWNAPLDWVEEEGRDGAVAVPFGGSPATDAFCDISRTASQALLRFLDHPVRFGIVFAFAVIAPGGHRPLLIAWTARCCGAHLWAESGPHPADRRRDPVRRAFTLAVHWLVVRYTPVDDVLDVLGDDSPWAAPFLAAIAAIVTLPVMAWVLAATVELVVDTDRHGDRRPGSWWMPKAAFATFVASFVLVLAFGVGTIVLLLLPLVALIASRWLVAPVVCADEVVPARAGLRRSARAAPWEPAAGASASRSRWASCSPCRASSERYSLVLTSVSFAVASVIVTLCAVVLVPYVALVLVHFYVELTESGTRRGSVGELVDGVDPAGMPRAW